SIVISGLGTCGVGLQIHQEEIMYTFFHMALSTDQSQIAIITSEDDGPVLQIITLSTGEQVASIDLTGYTNSHHPLHWAEDGMIYFSSTATVPAPYELSSTQADELSTMVYGRWDTSHDVQIYQVNPASGVINEFYYATNQWAISRIQSVDGY